jgi:hypothetical protein
MRERRTRLGMSLNYAVAHTSERSGVSRNGLEVQLDMRIKLSIWGVLAAVAAMAVSGIAASTASAAFTLFESECVGGSNIDLCWSTTGFGPLLEYVGSEEFTATQVGNAILKSTLGGEKIEIICKSASTKGTINQSEPLVKNYTGTGTISYKECALQGAIAKKCKVPAEKATNVLEGKAGGTSEDVTFTPKAGEAFIEFPFENNGAEKCPATIVGNKKVTGLQLCEWQNPGVAAKAKELKCDPLSELLLAEQKVELDQTDNVTLNNSGVDSWDVSDTI